MNDTEIRHWFEKFRSAYPKRDGSNPAKPAWEKWRKLMALGHDPADIIAGADAYCAEMVRQNKNNSSYVAMAATWLNQLRWQDFKKTPAVSQPMVVRTFVEADTPQWLDVSGRWRAKHGVSPPQSDFPIDGRLKRGWYFTREYAAQ